VSSPKPVTGQLTLSAPTALGLRSFNATNGAPPNSEEWKRFSGAAFLNQHSGVLVGIASAIMRAAGNDLLWLTQVADLAEGLEFQDFWTEAGMPRPSRFHASGNAPPRLLIDPLAYLHQFDRTRPADRIVDVLDPPMDEQPNGNVEAAPATAALDEAKVPPVFLIAGRWMDLPDEMVKRIRDQILPELLGNRHGDAVWLKWRYAGDGYSPDQIVAKLREEVAVSLAAPRPRHIASLAPLGESARHRDWNLVIGVDKANEQDAQALCQFLGEFAKLGGRQGPPSLYVNVVSDTSLAVMQDPRIKSFTRLVKEGSASLTGRIVLVDEIYLHDCAFEDIALWSKDLENYCRTTAEQCRTYLERALPNGTYPLRDVKESLSGLVPAR
jgi:hypothetical protein